MALKRRSLRKNLTTDELLLAINRSFIKHNVSSVTKIPKFNIELIELTCLEYHPKRFLVCDSRENEYEGERPDDMLPCYYGATIHEALMEAYKNHG